MQCIGGIRGQMQARQQNVQMHGGPGPLHTQCAALARSAPSTAAITACSLPASLTSPKTLEMLRIMQDVPGSSPSLARLPVLVQNYIPAPLIQAHRGAVPSCRSRCEFRTTNRARRRHGLRLLLSPKAPNPKAFAKCSRPIPCRLDRGGDWCGPTEQNMSWGGRIPCLGYSLQGHLWSTVERRSFGNRSCGSTNSCDPGLSCRYVRNACLFYANFEMFQKK